MTKTNEIYYKLIIINYMNETMAYFKEMTNENIPLFTNDIDYAMNFSKLQENEIDHFLELISKQLWKLSHLPDIKNLEVFEMKIKTEIKKTPYKNEDFETMNAIRKLTPREIEILGLEDYGLLYKLQYDDTTNDISNYYFIRNGGSVSGSLNLQQSMSIGTTSYVSNNLLNQSYKDDIQMSPEEYLLNCVKTNWDKNDEL